MEPEGADKLSLLSVDDFKERNIKIDPNWTGFEALMAVVEVAYDKEEKKKEEEQRLMREKAIKKPVSEGSVAVKERNFLKKKDDDQEWSVKCQHGRSRTNNLERRQQTCRNQTVQDMPESMRKLIESMNGTDIMLVIDKYLFATDMNNNHNRMSVPINQVRSDFLNQQEKEYLDQDGQMKVVFIEPSLEVSVINFRKWDMSKPNKHKPNGSYALKTFWNHVKFANGLKEGDRVQLWSFRVNKQLHLALVKVGKT